MESWQANLDLGNFNMTIKEGDTVDVEPLIEDDVGHGQTILSEPDLESELFFIERFKFVIGRRLQLWSV